MVALGSASNPDASLKSKLKRLLDMTGAHVARMCNAMSPLVTLHITAWKLVLTICDWQALGPLTGKIRSSIPHCAANESPISSTDTYGLVDVPERRLVWFAFLSPASRSLSRSYHMCQASCGNLHRLLSLPHGLHMLISSS